MMLSRKNKEEGKIAGYDNFSKSNNALEAEENGLYPLTKAVKVVARKAGCTQKEARKVLVELGPREWHHTSKFYNPVDYYDANIAINLIKYGTEESPEEIEEQEAWEREYAEILKKQASCKHKWTGEAYRWYCPLCKAEACVYSIEEAGKENDRKRKGIIRGSL